MSYTITKSKIRVPRHRSRWSPVPGTYHGTPMFETPGDNIDSPFIVHSSVSRNWCGVFFVKNNDHRKRRYSRPIQNPVSSLPIKQATWRRRYFSSCLHVFSSFFFVFPFFGGAGCFGPKSLLRRCPPNPKGRTSMRCAIATVMPTIIGRMPLGHLVRPGREGTTLCIIEAIWDSGARVSARRAQVFRRPP